jgi:hypothetical protein
MRDTYRNTTNLVVWLRPKGDDSAASALEFCNAACHHGRENKLDSEADAIANYQK